MPGETRDGQRNGERLPDNSDPTGIGPPPPGAETRVEDGRGVTTGPDPDSDGGGARQPGQ